jgi:iron(III) transport system ATP-binding protein
VNAGDLVVTALTKSFGAQRVLDGLSLTVPAGTFTALLGPSGSGKTTLLRTIAGFERPDSGTITIGPDVVSDDTRCVRPERRRVGYVSQDGSLFPHLTVAANVAFGLPRSQRRGPRIAELLDLVGLTVHARQYPHELSGGQQQRVALARALAVDPTLVLLDEPFAALDDALRQSVRDDVVGILAHLGATTILVTHDQDEALSTASLVAVLRNGVVAQFATPADLYAHPADADLATIVGGANVVTGTQRDGVVNTPLGILTLESNAFESGDITVLVRPEQVCVERGVQPGVTGRVTSVRFHGHDVVVTVAVDSTGNEIVARVLGARTFAVGDEVTLTITTPVSALA